MEPQELLAAIRHVSGEGRYVSPRSAANLLMQMDRRREGAPHEKLTAREMQVMMKIVRGMSLRDVGVQMCLSVKTVSTHRVRIIEKLGLASNAELVQYATGNGLLD